mgnify:CR=1 FL=1
MAVPAKRQAPQKNWAFRQFLEIIGLNVDTYLITMKIGVYLSVKLDGKRRMVYIPPALEQDARQRVAAWRETEKLTQTVSDACVIRLLERKRNKKNGGQEK